MDFNKIREEKSKLIKLYLYDRGFYHSYNTAVSRKIKAYSYEGTSYNTIEVCKAIDEHFGIKRDVRVSNIDK